MAGRLVDSLRSLQTENGAWLAWPGGPDDLDTSVTAYLALRVAGIPAEDATLSVAASFIELNGGINGTDPFTKGFIAVFAGNTPRIKPGFFPEMLVLPAWAGIHYHAVPAWARVLAVPLSVATAVDTSARFGDMVKTGELGLAEGKPISKPSGPLIARVFGTTLRTLDRLGIRPWRQAALEASRDWLLDRSSGRDGPGASAPALVRLLIALTLTNESPDGANLSRVLQSLEELVMDEGGPVTVAPEESPVWDTANVLRSFYVSGMGPIRNPILRAAAWLLDQEVTDAGEWQIANPNVRASGWARTKSGRQYPDVANSGCVLVALQSLQDDAEEVHGARMEPPAATGLMDPALLAAATQRGLAWLLSMQNGDGGWSYWDKLQKNLPETGIPVTGNSMAPDRSTAESTGLAVAALRGFGYGKGAPAIDRALQYLIRTQQEGGFWDSPSCNEPRYITWRVLHALQGIRDDSVQACRDKAAQWLVNMRNADGGWSCQRQDDSNAQSTAWTVLGLLCCGVGPSDTVADGINYLIATQESDGSWQAGASAAPQAPGLVSYTNELASVYYPLMALGEYRRMLPAGTA